MRKLLVRNKNKNKKTYNRGGYLSECVVGTTGSLCSLCVQGYARLGDHFCSPCYGVFINLVVFSLVILAVLLILGIFI